MPLSFCVVIPMYNEAHGAEKCVRAVCEVLEQMPHRTALIVVNDGSQDETGEILERLKAEFQRLEIVTHSRNRGYGAGIQSGTERAAELESDYALFMDSDLTNHPRDLPLFVDKMLAGFDFIKASRYIPGGGMVGVPWWRMMISIAGNRLAGLLYGLPIRDCTNGFRAARVPILRQMTLNEPGFPVIMEELYQAKFLARTFCEVPNILTARAKTEKASSFTYSPRVFYSYLKYPVKCLLTQAPRRAPLPTL
jgi:dolichol-phosphate mannosyltransferase